MALSTAGSRTANSSRSAQGTEDVNFTLPNITNAIILGTGMMDNNSDGVVFGHGIDLEFRKGVDAYTSVVTGSGAVRLTSSTDLVQANNVTSGERLTTGSFGSYVEGEEIESTNPTTQMNTVSDKHTEFQWGLDFSNASLDETYDFRVVWDATSGQFNIDYVSIVTPPPAHDLKQLKTPISTLVRM